MSELPKTCENCYLQHIPQDCQMARLRARLTAQAKLIEKMREAATELRDEVWFLMSVPHTDKAVEVFVNWWLASERADAFSLTVEDFLPKEGK